MCEMTSPCGFDMSFPWWLMMLSIFSCTWESQFLGRLIRSSGSPRRKKGSGVLKVEIGGVWNSQGGEKDNVVFPLHCLVLVNYITQFKLCQFSSEQLLSHIQLFATPWPEHARPPCPSWTPRVHPNPCPLSWWCHSIISYSVIPFSSRPQSFPVSGSFKMTQLFTSGGQLQFQLQHQSFQWTPTTDLL